MSGSSSNQKDRTTTTTTAKDSFLHLVSIITLFASVISLVIILFQSINVYMPNLIETNSSQRYHLGSNSATQLGSSSGIVEDTTPPVFFRHDIEEAKESIRTSLSVLIIMLPIYLWTIYYLGKARRKPDWNKNEKINSILINFTLFAGSMALIIALIILLNTVLKGKLTLDFGVKILGLFIIVGSVTSYYLYLSNVGYTKKTKNG